MSALVGCPCFALKEVHYFLKFEKLLFHNFSLLDTCYLRVPLLVPVCLDCLWETVQSCFPGSGNPVGAPWLERSSGAPTGDPPTEGVSEFGSRVSRSEPRRWLPKAQNRLRILSMLRTAASGSAVTDGAARADAAPGPRRLRLRRRPQPCRTPALRRKQTSGDTAQGSSF